MPLDLPSIRAQFPGLDQTIDGNPLIYLDSAATAQKPRCVIDALESFLVEADANVHRGMHPLAERATVAYEDGRETVRSFLNAASLSEIIFTKCTTESLNLVAKSWGKANLKKGDTVALSLLEHHSNIVPWLQLKEEIGISVRWIELDDDLNISLDSLDAILKDGCAMISITARSNVTGTQTPLKEIIARTHAAGALVTVDAAQSVAHSPIDVQKLDCDFLAFSGYKVYGPGGLGVLYGKKEHLKAMPPFLGGGMMISEVTRDGFTPADLPQKFEAGTPAIASVVGLAAAIDWLTQHDWKDIQEHEAQLREQTIQSLQQIDGLSLFTNLQPTTYNLQPSQEFIPHTGCVSFTLDGVHPHDLTHLLGERGICLRAGHHCCQPLHDHLGVPATTRVSLGIYNTIEEIDALAPAIKEVKKLLS